MKSTDFRQYIVVLFSAAILTTCGKDSSTKSDPITPFTPIATRVEISPSVATLNAIGQTVQLTARVFDQNNNIINGAVVTWSSSDVSVVTVSTQGLVTAVKDGPARITATSGSVTHSIYVTVMQVARSIVIEPTEASLMEIGATVQLAATVLDRNGQQVAGAVVTWSSSDVSVVTVSTQGLVTAVQNGPARITASSQDVSASINVTVESFTPSPDRDALMAFYHNTGGPDWTNNTNWLGEAPVGEWHGVETDTRGRVTVLKLYNNNISGSLPPELGQLVELKELVITESYLTGSIPAELGQLTNLRKLSLGSRQLTGSIPAELSQLINLEILILVFSRFTGSIPAELGQLNNLTYLGLHNNQLTGSIPPELGQLNNLTFLGLHDNQLTGSIPPELGQLRKLETARLGFNSLTGSIPAELGQLSSLEVLELWFNQLTGNIPAELGRLNNLTDLNLDRNRLTGNIPPELGQLNNLKNLNLSRNPFVVGPIPAELGQLNNLVELWLGSMGLTGEIPPELGGLQSLRKLLLFHNQLSGRLPAELGRLTRLEILWLNHNRLTGELPQELGDLVNLKELMLWENPGLTGPIPESMTRLNLVTIRTSGTQLCAPPGIGFQLWLQGIDGGANVVSCHTPMNQEVYLTQAVQSFDRPVPLLEGEAALLRVFLSAGEPGVSKPEVHATFYIDGTREHAVDIPAGIEFVPDRIEQGSLAHSANALLPADLIRPGLEMVIEIGPEDSEDPGMGIGGRVPEVGRLPVDVRSVPPLNLILVPMLWSEDPDHSVVERLEGRTENDDLFRWIRDLLPVRDLDVTINEPLFTSIKPGEERLLPMLEELVAFKAMDGGEGYYMGVIELDSVEGISVLGGFGSVVSAVDGKIMAHQLGHNMSLLHAPCDVFHDLDSVYPYPDGSIGAWGYDVGAQALIDPATPDLMGNCFSNPWISDYHFKKAINFRVHHEAHRLSTAVSTENRSLLLWGGVSEYGDLYLEPAFVVDGQPAMPRSGPYRVAGENADGKTLFTLNFALSKVADGDGAGSFAFMIPIQRAWSGELSRITLSGPEGFAELTRDGDRAAALLLDQSTGDVRGILRDWPNPGTSEQTTYRVMPERGIDIVVSRGVPAPSDW